MLNESPDNLRLPNPPWYLRLLSLKVVIPTVLVLGMILAPFLVRGWHLALMPRGEEPFDRKELDDLQVPAAENAFTHYTRAEKLAVAVTAPVSETRDAVLQHGWERATPELERYLEANAPAIAEYRAGAKLAQGQCHPAREFNILSPLLGVQELREYAKNSLALAHRHEARGEYREAWGLLRDVARVSRHAGQYGSLIERFVGIALLSIVVEHLETWAAGKPLTAADLRQAILDLQQAWELTAPNSRVFQVEYLIAMNTLRNLETGQPGWNWADFSQPACSNGFLRYAHGEPELGCRVFRFYFQNQLKCVDLPRYSRPPLDLAGLLFDDPAGLTVHGQTLTPEQFERAYQKSPVVQELIFNADLALSATDREAARYQCCLCLLAAQAFYRDHRQFPKRLENLVPEYLEEIPPDPYDGKPLRYQAGLAQPTIYSVFKNLADDGGVSISFAEGLGEPADLGLRLITPSRPPVIAPRPDQPQP